MLIKMNKKVRIGVISDTHIPDRATRIPQKILEDFKKADMVIHAGDLVNMSALEQLKEVCSKVYAVYGNMDPYDLRKVLPEKEIIQVGKFRIGIMHGFGIPSGLPELLKRLFKDDPVNVIVFGHSHAPMNEKIGETLFFNPGSATDTIFAPYNSYGIIEINDKINAKIIKL